jgi:hypothetical protein
MKKGVQRALSVLMGQMVTKTPELSRVLDQAKAEKWTEEKTMLELMRLVQMTPGLEDRFVSVFRESTAPLRGGVSQTQADVPEGLFQGKGSKRWRLPPLFESALVERIQYDGDIPEHRTGPLPSGTDPAVSVQTRTRDPIALGRMLENASKQVRRKVEAHNDQRLQLVESIAADQADSTALQKIQEHGEIVRRDGEVQLDLLCRGSAATDHPTYRRGETPKPVLIRRPKGSFLANLNPEDRQKHAWKFLSTTQGRRSVITTIRGLIAEQFAADQIEVVEQDYDAKADLEPVAHHEWTVNLSGQGSTQPAFSLVNMAAKVLYKGLSQELGENRPTNLRLEVIAINQVDARSVGWGARLLASDPPLIG